MKDLQKSLTPQQKAVLITNVDATFSDSVKSMRRKLIQEGYLTSETQVNVLDKLLWGVKEAENSSLSKALFDISVKNKQVEFIQHILELFKEGWKLSRAFKFYTGGGPIKELNAWKLRRIIEVIEKKDRSDFDKLESDDNKKKAPIHKNAKPKSKKPVNDSSKKVPHKASTKEIPIITKK